MLGFLFWVEISLSGFFLQQRPCQGELLSFDQHKAVLVNYLQLLITIFRLIQGPFVKNDRIASVPRG